MKVKHRPNQRRFSVDGRRRRLRLRAGANVSRREYEGGRFDQTFLSVHAGPRWLVGRDTDASVLAIMHKRWSAGAPDHDAFGGRLEAGRRFTGRVTAHARAFWHDRRYRTRDYLDGPVVDASLGGAVVITPTVRANAALGWGRERPETERWRHERRWIRAGATVALPRGFTVGASAEYREADYEGNWFPHTAGELREDRTCSLPRLGAQPGPRLAELQPRGLRGARGPQDQRPALRLRADRRGAAVRQAVLMERGGRRMNEWEQTTISKISHKVGPDWYACVKCGDRTQFQAWPTPVFLVRQVESTPLSGPSAISVFCKVCRNCGFTELYCPDAIEG